MITITAYDWVPDFAKGLVRDLRVRWALEEAGLEYRVRLVTHNEKLTPSGTKARGNSAFFGHGTIEVAWSPIAHQFRV